jgi:hypothetical protein
VRQTPSGLRTRLTLCCVAAVVAAGLMTGGAAARSSGGSSIGLLIANASTKRLCAPASTVAGEPVATCYAVGLAQSDGQLLKFAPSAVPRNLVATSERVSPSDVISPLNPAQLHAAYSLPTTTSGSSTQTIAIVDAYDNPSAKSDLDYYSTHFGIPVLPDCSSTVTTSCFSKVNQSGGTSPLPPYDEGWAREIALDLDAAHAVCQNCKILLVEANSASFSDLAAAVTTAANLGATEISNSYGAQESYMDPSDFSAYAPYYRHAGIPVVASSGDDGWEPSWGVEASFPADINSVVAVGGTTLSTDPSSGAWLSETVWGDFDTGYGAGSGCSVFDTAQTWQTTTPGWSATGCGEERGVSDVAADADPYSGLWVYFEGSLQAFGGTSLAAPVIAATYALAANPKTVQYPSSVPYAHLSQFHDITVGTNALWGDPCTTTICQAAPGYDGPTGIGTPNGLLGFVVDTVDTTPPVTVASGYDSAWHNSAVQVALTAADNSGGSGVKSISYSIDGGAPTTVDAATTQVTIGAPADHSNDGVHTLSFYATDNDGNQETAQSVTVKIDTTPPTVSASGASNGAWLKHAATITLTAANEAGGSGTASIGYTLNGVAHTAAGASTQVVIPARPNATHTLTYQATDPAGNVSAGQSLSMHIDTKGPTTFAKPASGHKSKAGHKGKAIALKCRVRDNLSPRVTSVTLTIRNRRNKVVKTFKLGAKKVSAWYAVKWTPKAKGTYRYTVYAKDLAGNKQAKAGSAKITVK